ncbi:MAG: alanine--tRNA ligase [Bacilli bacterium]|nr:alanine--tRNA ligase [Bacilli bacterium]
MKYMTHNDIRKMWIDYFTKNGHKLYESAPLVPKNDNSLLWINAGVTPLKKFFDGTVVPDSKRIVDIQKCIRTNDIENVGITKRHQTFFEMMGNFSVGDYFKPEAIHFAFELLTSEKYFAIDKELIYVTYYPTDTDTKNFWIKEGMLEDHLVPLEANFWEIGEGPCGPDSEIFFDRGEKYDTPEKDALKKFKNDEDQERYVEIWNVVFSQFNSEEGKKRSEYKELPRKNIDTGAGLERWCTIFQNTDSNFETDLFTPIIKHIEELTTHSYVGQKEYKIIADHIKAITFALADGAAFENMGRGYVLRRLLRRSVRFGKNIGIECPFMYKLVSDVVDMMSEAYPYLKEKRPFVETLVLNEEKLFLKTLNQGERRLKELIKNSHDGIISGEDAFKLYDTYGFPYELTEEYLKELGYKTSREEFDKYMNIQKETARKSTKNVSAMAKQQQILLDYKEPSTFVYNLYRVKTKIQAIITSSRLLKALDKDGYIVLDRTCFYAESGGQISDTGMIIGDHFKARVTGVIKAPNGQHLHKVKLLDGIIKVGDSAEAVVDQNRRKKIEANHSTVHILQYILQKAIDKDIKQAGSKVADDKLRFDFTYSGQMTDEKVLKVEKLVNEMINQNLIVSTEIMPLNKAKELGAMALFEDKYQDTVRVVKIGKSIELCGGTHTTNTKNIKRFAITLVESKGSNIYRIEGATSDNIEKELYEVISPYNDEIVKLLLKAKEIKKQAKQEGIDLDFDIYIDNKKPSSYQDIINYRNQLEYVQTEVKELEKKYLDIKKQQVMNNLDEYKKNFKKYNDITYLIIKTDNKDSNVLKTIADSLVNNEKNYFIFIANIKEDNSVHFIARSTSNKHAGLLVKKASQMSGGNGGGRDTFAEGGGKTSDNIDEVLTAIEKELKDE